MLNEQDQLTLSQIIEENLSHLLQTKVPFIIY